MTDTCSMKDLWRVKDANSEIAYKLSTSTEKLREFFTPGANEVERKIEKMKTSK